MPFKKEHELSKRWEKQAREEGKALKGPMAVLQSWFSQCLDVSSETERAELSSLSHE